MKPLFKVILSVLALLVAGGIGGYFYMRQRFLPPANQLVVSRLPASCAFTWLADTAAGRAMPHAGLLVPVQLPNCPHTCYLQFDTGAPYSVLYARPLAALQARYPALPFGSSSPSDTLHNFRFAMGRGQVQAHWVRVMPRGADALPADSTAPFIIGTLGADVLDGRVLVLDYARQRFSLDTRVPDSLTHRTAFVPLAFTNRRVLLSMQLQGEPRQLLFDSGTSAFTLLTSQATWQELARPQAPVHTVPVKSWDKTLTAHTVATAASLQLGPAALPLRTVTYMEGTSLMQNLLMRFSGMGGMLGNEPFREHAVILDVPAGRFGLVRP
ncbi:hypothetical protein Q3A66_04755 [Hymenobacter sp. BT770]|uniref:hypothetical protein n=1 Tax=Hymenobacter sp. BT770 TaxID=2886942 RepID=UPI001D105126|nr:hypothetical protein [Hymenobacter sp. BT770]MCC3154187.1 hypothetical protein [Hymenobacter sp. BT770]MDO3414366.1 hypothetical protein [Hymenobacter sp. BT770]